MKKIVLTLFSFTLAIIFIGSQTSCKKETVTVTVTDTISVCPATILGLWEGTYQTDQVSHQPLPIAFTFYSDGSMSYKATGNPPAQAVLFTQGRWSVSNNVLTFTDTTVNYSSVLRQSGSFNYDSVHNTLTNGVWQDLTPDGGQFYTGTFPTMNKVE